VQGSLEASILYTISVKVTATGHKIDDLQDGYQLLLIVSEEIRFYETVEVKKR
jgi:hypothetical protein